MASSPSSSRTPEPRAPLVSVIVPVRNGGRLLPALLEALRQQSLSRERFEVVIADDGSEQAPIELATADGHVRVLPNPPTNSYAARNRGVAASEGEILAFCDADCLPEPDWLERGLAAIDTGELIAGRIRFVVPERRTVWSLLDIAMSKNQALQVTRGLAETANLFVRRALFERVGGFESDVMEHGDWDFVERCVAAGARLEYGPDAVVWHPVRTTASSFLHAQWIYSRGYGERRATRHEQVRGLTLRAWVPLVGPIREQRRSGMGLGAASPWLAENGVHPTMREQILVLPLMYLVVPYTRNAAQVVGAIAGMRRRS